MKLRKIQVQSTTWSYHIGTYYAVLFDSAGRKYVVKAADLAGIRPELLDRGRWKKTTDGMITPKQVRAFIEDYVAAQELQHVRE